MLHIKSLSSDNTKTLFLKKLAIVAGLGGYNDIGLVRSCGEAGMEVVLITPKDIVVPIYRSRYVKEWLPTDVSDEKALLLSIRQVILSNQDKQIYLYPAADITAFIFDKYHTELSQSSVVPNAKGELNRLMDKSIMTSIAESVGMTVPKSLSFSLFDQIDITSIPFPCIIKPLRSVYGEKGDISICHSSEDFNIVIETFRRHGTSDILIQEFINGKNQEEIAVSGVVTPCGEIIAQGTIHKKRIRGNGSTVYGEYIPLLPNELAIRISEFMKKTQFIGIFDMEFLSNDSDIYFIECNFRNGAYGYAITKAGCNLPAIFAGGSPTPRPKHMTFMEERSDILNMLEGKLGKLQWVHDFLFADVHLWLNSRDPKPMLRIPSFIKKLF